jgi:hypothetical protein
MDPKGRVPVTIGGLLALFALGAGATALGLGGLLAQALGPRARRAAGAVALALLTTLGAAGLALDEPRIAWLPAAALTGVWGLFQAAGSPRGRQFCAWAISRVTQPCWQWGLLLGAGLALTGACWQWSEADADAEIESVMDLGIDRKLKAALEEVTHVTALTDRGRRVPLFQMPSHVLPPGAAAEKEARMAGDTATAMQFIRTAPPDWQSNCHGWAFTGGRWWILGADVRQVLEDNGYGPVTEPRPGDLVIYRDAAEQISHTAVVRGTTGDGRVLVEGKWSWLGVYLHRSDVQAYGTPSYCRSPRAGHLLRGLGVEPTAEPRTDSPGLVSRLPPDPKQTKATRPTGRRLSGG